MIVRSATIRIATSTWWGWMKCTSAPRFSTPEETDTATVIT